MAGKAPGKYEGLEFETGEGRTRIRARILPMGEHFIIGISGGEEHIGAAALAEPYPSRENPEEFHSSVSLLTRTRHKETSIAEKFARKLTSGLKVPVLICCGIHLDNITSEEIWKIEKNSDILVEKLIESLS